MITTEKMARLEKLSWRYGVSTLKLMENAGSGLARVIAERYDLGRYRKRILVVCYHGNNGGDGFVAARHLQKIPKLTVHVAFLGETEKLKAEAETNFERLDPGLLVSFERIDPGSYDIIVDALLGTGTKGRLREPLASAVECINASAAPVVAVDVPTGLNPDTGEWSSPCIDAELIITFHDIKQGLVKAGLENKCIIVDIGVPEAAVDELDEPKNLDKLKTSRRR